VKSEKKPGGQSGHPRVTLQRVANPDHRVVQRLTVCQECEKSLEHVPALRHDIRQVFDLPPVSTEVPQHE
jgi:transposase